jgi:hypothetical protein
VVAHSLTLQPTSDVIGLIHLFRKCTAVLCSFRPTGAFAE